MKILHVQATSREELGRMFLPQFRRGGMFLADVGNMTFDERAFVSLRVELPGQAPLHAGILMRAAWIVPAGRAADLPSGTGLEFMAGDGELNRKLRVLLRSRVA